MNDPTEQVSALEASDTRIRARARARAAGIFGACIVILGIIAAGAFVGGTLWTEHERDAQVAQNTRQVAHSARVAARAAVTADTAAGMAKKNFAIVFAVCRAFHRRDEVATYYDARLDEIRQKYGYGSSAFLDHAKPIIEERKHTLAKLAGSDCNALMDRAMADSTLPASKRPTPIPIASNLKF